MLQIGLAAYASGWNTLNMETLISLLAKDVVYESQMVIEPLRGSEEVGIYLRGKMQAVREAGPDYAVVAEIGTVPSLASEPCVILIQGDVPSALAFLKVTDSAVKRIDLCIVPDPSSAVRTGIIPT